MDEAEELELRKEKVFRELREDLERWARSRFWITATLVTVAGFFGVRELIQNRVDAAIESELKATHDQVEDLRRQVADDRVKLQVEAQATVEQAKAANEAAQSARQSAAQAEGATGTSVSAVDALSRKLSQFEDSLAAAERHQDEVIRRANSLLDEVRLIADGMQRSTTGDPGIIGTRLDCTETYDADDKRPKNTIRLTLRGLNFGLRAGQVEFKLGSSWRSVAATTWDQEEVVVDDVPEPHCGCVSEKRATCTFTCRIVRIDKRQSQEFMIENVPVVCGQLTNTDKSDR